MNFCSEHKQSRQKVHGDVAQQQFLINGPYCPCTTTLISTINIISMHVNQQWQENEDQRYPVDDE